MKMRKFAVCTAFDSTNSLEFELELGPNLANYVFSYSFLSFKLVEVRIVAVVGKPRLAML